MESQVVFLSQYIHVGARRGPSRRKSRNARGGQWTGRRRFLMGSNSRGTHTWTNQNVQTAWPINPFLVSGSVVSENRVLAVYSRRRRWVEDGRRTAGRGRCGSWDVVSAWGRRWRRGWRTYVWAGRHCIRRCFPLCHVFVLIKKNGFKQQIWVNKYIYFPGWATVQLKQNNRCNEICIIIILQIIV